MNDIHGWNFKDIGDGKIAVCKNEHERGDKCEYEPLTIEDADQMMSYIALLKTQIAAEVFITLSQKLTRLTEKGFAPCIVYDDDGHWAVSDEACGSGTDRSSMTVIVEPQLWRDSPDKAMAAFMAKLKWEENRE